MAKQGVNPLPDRKFMQIAIEECYKGIDRGENPFGAVIIKNGQILSKAYDLVSEKKDPSCHAEMVAIRRATRETKSIDLSGCVMYSTCEPCPMCFTYCHLSKIGSIIFGTSIEDGRILGYLRDTISSNYIKRNLKSKIKIIGGFMRQDTMELIKRWEERRGIINKRWNRFDRH